MCIRDRINKGTEQIRCLRLSPKGLFRWYTECCNTPIGNTLGPSFPFIGIIHNFMNLGDDRNNILGPVLAHIGIKDARGTPDYPNAREKVPIGLLFRMLHRMLYWKLKGMGRPSAFFKDGGAAIVAAKIMSRN